MSKSTLYDLRWLYSVDKHAIWFCLLNLCSIAAVMFDFQIRCLLWLRFSVQSLVCFLLFLLLVAKYLGSMWLIIPCFSSLLGFQITKFVSQRSHKELHPAQLNLVKIIVSLSMKIYSSFVRSRCEFLTPVPVIRVSYVKCKSWSSVAKFVCSACGGIGHILLSAWWTS
jgi:hypothetical protein